MSFGIGSFNPVQAVSTIALATATGGSSLIAQLAMRVAAQVVKEVIQQVGQQLGMPQEIIDAAQGSVAATTGDYAGAAAEYAAAAGGAAGIVAAAGEQFGASPSEIGSGQREIEDIKDQMIRSMVERGSQDEDGNSRGLAAGRGGGGRSWLMALAKALGAQLNAAQNELERTMDGTNWKKADQVAEFQAQSQQFALFMNTATNVIKTVGESLSTMARKQ